MASKKLANVPPFEILMHDPMSQKTFPSTQIDEQLLSEGVQHANLATLLMTLYQLTGDAKWLDTPYRMSVPKTRDDTDSGGLSPALQAEIRAAAFQAIRGLLDGNSPIIVDPTPQQCVDIVTAAMGGGLSANSGPLLLDTYRDGFSDGQQEPIDSLPEGFRVIVIGAAASGLAMAVHLKHVGVPFTLLERDSDVGGSWFSNRYPGCGVDTPSHYYSFRFTDHDWSMFYPLRDEIYAYMRTVAEKFDLRRHIRFGTEVKLAEYDAATQQWIVTVTNDQGEAEQLTADIVVSAVGIFNPPLTPDLKGLESFQGEVLHTANWREGADLSGKRVALIGTGASAMQVGPELQKIVDRLVVFQRSKHWSIPFPDFRRNISPGVRYLLKSVPIVGKWYRVRLSWMLGDANYPLLQKDPNWHMPDRSLSQASEDIRQRLEAYVRSELGDREDLVEKVIPAYPPWGKRMLRDNGWYRMLTRPNVVLETDRIDHVTGHSIATASTEHEVDAVVMATGFDVQKFISTYEVVGRSGRTLRDHWGDDEGRAYLGCVVPDFPNYFCIYGPNTQPAHGGSIIHTFEMQAHYVVAAIREMVARGIGAIELRQEVHDRYNIEIDAQHDKMVWTHPGVQTYYRNSSGRVPLNYPFPNARFFTDTREIDLQEYHLEPRVAPVSRARSSFRGRSAAST